MQLEVAQLQKLSREVLEDAIADVKECLWSGSAYSESLVAAVAADHEIRVEALTAHFERRYPKAEIGNKPPTPEQIVAGAAKAQAARVLHEYARWTTVDGREVILDGKLYTLVAENRSRKFVVAFRHEDLRVLEIKATVFRKMTAAPPT